MFDGRGVDQWNNIQSCIETALSSGSIPPKPTSPLSPHAVNKAFDEAQALPLLLEIESAFTPYHAAAVRSLASCVQRYVPKLFKHRGFTKGGGNDVTFVNHVVALFFPAIARLVQEIAEFAFAQSNHWQEKNYPLPGECGIRTSEFLNYTTFKSLGEYGDSGSVYTVIFSLSAPEDYVGGEYFIKDSSGDYHYFKPKQYSAMVFLSESKHGVTDIESGHREMYTNEYWRYDDPPFPHYRPRLERMELFLERCKQSQSVTFEDVEWPVGKVVDEWLSAIGREGEKNGKRRKRRNKKCRTAMVMTRVKSEPPSKIRTVPR